MRSMYTSSQFIKAILSNAKSVMKQDFWHSCLQIYAQVTAGTPPFLFIFLFRLLLCLSFYVAILHKIHTSSYSIFPL